MVSKKHGGGVRRRRNIASDLAMLAGQRIAQWAGRRFHARAAAKQAARRRVKSSQKTQIATGRVYNEGTGGQYSYFNGKPGKSYLPAHVEHALAPQVIQNASATQLKSSVGKQAVLTVLQLCQPSLATSFIGDKISRVMYESSRGDVTINNIFLSNCYLIIYDVMARRDLATSSNIYVPTSAWAQGGVDETATNSYTLLGSTPWQAECFNQFYKVCQVTNVVLAAGATHVHKVRLTPKREISASYAQYSNGTIADLCYFTVIEIHGSPANDTTTQTSVSVGVAGVNVVVDQEETLKLLQKHTPTITTNNSLATSFAVGEQVINMGGSIITTNAEG